jgi:hypothetical protein
MIRAAACVCGWLVASALAATSPVFAQGRPTTPPGQAKRVQQVPRAPGLVAGATGNPDLTSASGRVRTLGAWLDDASTLAPGESWVTLSLSKWVMPVASGTDAPVMDFSIGLSPRIQTSVTVPYFRISDGAGQTVRGLGDLYVATKVVVRDAGEHTYGVSIGPTLDILSVSSAAGSDLPRVNWIFPVNLERRFSVGRVYGSTGYFSRGVVFASGAFERRVHDRLAVSAAVTQSFATRFDTLNQELGLSRQRVDVSGTASYSVAPALAVFGSMGRTVWGLDEDSTRLVASAGVSVNMKR